MGKDIARVSDELDSFVDPVYRFALTLSRDRHRAEDLTQECFLRAIRSADSIRDANKMRSWLFQILVNVWRDDCRRQGRNREISMEGDLDPCSRTLGPEFNVMLSERYAQVISAMQTLPDQQRQVLYLVSVEGIERGEVARLLNISTNAVKANLHIARKSLRRSLTSEDQTSRPAP